MTSNINKVSKETIQNCFKQSGFEVSCEKENNNFLCVEELNFSEADFQEFVTFDDDVAVCIARS